MARILRLLCGHVCFSLVVQIALLCLVTRPAWAHDTGEVHVHFGVTVVNGTTALLAGIFALLTGVAVYRQAYFHVLRQAGKESGRHEPSY